MLLLLAALLTSSGCSAVSSDVEDAVASPNAAAGTAGRGPAEGGPADDGAATGPVGVVTGDDDPVATDPPRPSTTDVQLSYLYWDGTAGAVLGSGYVSPLVEDGGTCTLELSRSGETVVATSTATADATTSSCGEMAVPREQLTPGEWTAVLRYSSATSTGGSAELTVAVG